MKKAFIVISVGIIFILVGLVGTHRLIGHNKKQTINYWWQDVLRTSGNYTLLIGSSSIIRLPISLLDDCKPTVKYGFVDGNTEDVLLYLTYAQLNNVKKVVLYIGENDITNGELTLTTAKQVIELVNVIKMKTDAPVGLVKLKYSPGRASVHKEILHFNMIIENHFANSEQVSLLPFDKIEQHYLFSNDGVHLNKGGNMQFTQLISEFCQQ